MSIKLKVQAAGDLLARYRAVFAHAWQQRRAMAGPGYTSHEAQFLPAALALQETPISPAPRVAMWVLIAFALITLLWTVFGKIDVVASAEGKIVPNDRVKTIQPLDRATVTAIHVTDGQAVKAGDVLVEFDAATAQADQDRVRSDLAAARLQAARAKGMLQALETGRVPAIPRPERTTDTNVDRSTERALQPVWRLQCQTHTPCRRYRRKGSRTALHPRAGAQTGADLADCQAA